jgi:ferredoxin
MGAITDRKHKIEITDADQTLYRFLCKEEESLLDAFRRESIKEIPKGCGGGGCGACKIRINSGDAKRRRMSSAHIGEDEIREQIVLACCVKPRSDMVISFMARA